MVSVLLLNQLYRVGIMSAFLLFYTFAIHMITLDSIYEYNIQTAQGLYTPILNIMSIEHADSWRAMNYIANHEWAHHMYAESLTDEDIARWQNLSNQTKVWHTQYAKTDIKEDFAEFVAVSTVCSFQVPEYLETYEPEKVAFVRSVIDNYD